MAIPVLALTDQNATTSLSFLPDTALQFREMCGGEERIMKYNHDLVKDGAALLANELNTSYMENSEKSLIGCMVSIRDNIHL